MARNDGPSSTKGLVFCVEILYFANTGNSQVRVAKRSVRPSVYPGKGTSVACKGRYIPSTSIDQRLASPTSIEAPAIRLLDSGCSTNRVESAGRKSPPAPNPTMAPKESFRPKALGRTAADAHSKPTSASTCSSRGGGKPKFCP